jgi:hypothetical protein
MIKVNIREVDWSNATCAWRRDIVVRDLPPLLLTCADFAPCLALKTVQVLVVCGAFQGDGVGVVAVLNRPLLLGAAIAFVLDDDAGRAPVFLVCQDMSIGDAC